MSIFHNGKEYGATKVINYSAAPDYNKGVSVTNIQDGNYQAADNGFLVITLQSQQSNVTKVSVVRSKTPIADNEGIEIASRVIQQFQYSETLIAQVMARDYYKLVIEGVGNPQIISCVFYPYVSNIPIKLTESIDVSQVVGLGSLATKSFITAAELADNAVTTNKIAEKAVSAAKIADNTITGNQIANNAVGTAEIANLAVTTAKIANGAINLSDVSATSKTSGVLAASKGGFDYANLVG